MGGVLVSCNNILEGGDFKEQLEKDIAYANAKSLEIIVQPREGTGSTIPSGKQTVKQGYPLEISFSEAGSYSFIKWIAVSQEDGSELEGIVFDDPKSPKTNVTVNIDSADVRIIPECSERIVVTEANPGYSDAGVSRDRAITVTFSQKPSKSSFIFSESEIPADATNKKAVFDDEKNEVPGEFWAYTLGGQTYLKNVSITNSDGISLAEHFLQPELDGNILTVPVDRSNSIEIESGSSLTIVVTISDGVCDDNGVTMNGEKQWRYRATEATDEKATLTLSCENDEGSVYLAGTRDYNISQKITLSFTENADYQFLRWNYDSKIVNIAEPDKINTTAIVVEKTDASEIKAVCAKRLRVSSFSPKIDDKTPSVSKNSSIIITFDHDLPTDAEGYAQLSNISIAVGGSPVKSSFLEPVINGSSVTFAADKTNMLEVPGEQTKTVTVSVPADFFYKTDDGAKVTFGGNGEVFNYKIDSTTLEKAEITFGAAKDSGAITPSAGTYHYSIGSEIPLTFIISDGWQFNGWSVSGADQNVADKIKIADEKALSTKISVYEALQGVTVTAKTSECLRVTETSPSAKTNPKDSSIIITFNKPLAGECSSLLNKIRVSSDGNNLDSYYTDRSISEISGDNGDFKQITIKNTSYLSVPKNSTKIITVTVPSDFYYNDGETKINLTEDSFSFTIDHTTEAKTGITYKVVNGEDGSSLSAGTINRSSYEEYNIGEEVELSLDLYSGYQFCGWDITDSSGYSVTDQISYVNSNSSYLAPTLSINKSADGITVSAICYKRPTISTSSVVPYSSNPAEEVAKNTPIVLTFDHAISAETKDEIIVTYSAISNFNKDSYFSTSISNDNKTVTLTPIKMLPLEHAYETVTVTVPCQKVYYLASDGRTKITPADKDFSWSYRVNNSTLTKTVVRFATNDASVTGRQINAAGTLLSSGTKQDMNVEQTVNLEFPVESGYKFAGWKVESATTGYTVEPEGYVTSGTIIVKNEDKSYFTLVIDGTNPAKAVITSNDAIGNGTDGYGITVLAKDVLLPAITNFAPSSENINPKDSTITIKFNKNLAESCSASLDLIKITMNGNDVSGFFEKRELKNNVITIKNTSLLDVTGSATKKITVTVPAVFYYEPEEGFRAYLSKEESFEYKIDSSTANKTKIRFDSSENSKKTLKVNEASTNDGGTVAYNRGETVKLEYEVPAGYKFAGWKIVSPSSDYTVSPSDYVTSGTITVKNGDDTYLTLKVDSDNPSKAIVETIDAIEDYETSGYGIKVLAKDVVLPVVDSVKINNTTSIYAVPSSSCDSKIYINFSKPIDTTTATLSSSGSITITKAGMSTSHYESYFTASWSSDKKQLVLTSTNEVSKLVSNESDTFGFVITLNANRKEIKDIDGCSLIESSTINNSFDIPYTVNGVRETTKPVFYSTQNLYDKEDSSTRKTLDAKAFSSWGSTASYYTSNHINDSVYFSMYGYDKDSGLKALRITETYYKTVAGENASGETIKKDYALSTYGEHHSSFATDGTKIYRFTGTHNLQTVNDGVIKLDFQLVDNAGNVSSVTTYYVIKDTVIDESVVKFDETKQDALAGSGLSVYNSVRKRSGDNDTVTLTLSSIPQDIFYGTTYKTDYDISVKYGYSKENISNNAVKSTPSTGKMRFTFTHLTKQTTFVEITVSDAAGNTKKLIRAIPGQAVITSQRTFTDSDVMNWDMYEITCANKEQNESLSQYYGASSFMTNTLIMNTTEGNSSWYKGGARDYVACIGTDSYGNTDFKSPKGKTLKVYAFVGYKYGDATTIGDTNSEYWYSSLSDEYVEIIASTTEDWRVSGSYLRNTATSGLSSNYVIDYLKVTTEPVVNSGCYKVVVSDEFISRIQSEHNVDTTGITYSIIAKNSSGEKIESKDLTFYLPSPGKYELFLKAENSNRQSVTTSSYRFLKINGTGSEKEQYLTFTDDLTAPSLNLSSDENFYSYSPAYWYTYYYSAIVSDNGTAGLVTDSDGNVLLDYYFIPNSNSTLSVLASEQHDRYLYLHNTYTLEELETQYFDLKKTIAIAPDATSLQIPFDGLPEGLYTICIVAKDNNGNYTVKCRTAFNKRLHETLVLSKLYSNTYSYFFRANKRFEVKWLESGAWTKKGSYANYEGQDPQVEFNKSSLGNWWIKIDAYFKNGCSVAESGFYDTIYLNLGYYKQLWEEGASVMDVSSKNIIPGLNGMQVLCSSPTLVHTMYCSRKLSDGTSAEDIATWENMAMETGIVEKSSNFTYGNDNYDAIPSGYYYTTIVHFADGTTLMTDVKRK